MTKPTNIEYRRIFDAVADRYDAMTSKRAVRARIKWFIARARGRVLEVGAGTGRLSRALRERGFKVVTTDNSPRMVALLETESLTCDAEGLPFEGGSFDTVIGSEMIYYLDRPERFVAEAYRVLCPEGRLLISSANNKARFIDRIRALLRLLGIGGTYFDDKIRTFYDKKSLRGLVVRAGFTVKELKTILLGTFVVIHAEK